MQTLRRWVGAGVVVGLVAWCLAPGLRAAIQSSPPGFDPAAATVGNARLLARAVTEYAQDNDEHLPPTQTVTEFQAAVRPYLDDPAVFVSPETQRPFDPNPAISGQMVTALADAETVRLFQDAPIRMAPVVGFLDGHIERGGVEQGDPNQIVFDRAHSLALGALQYIQDYDETLPPMQDAAAFQAAIYPYVRSHRAFETPTGAAFVSNAKLSGVPLMSIPNPGAAVLFQDDQPYVDGQPTVAYVSGRVIHGALSTVPSSDLANLHQLSLGVVEYEQDNDQLPPTDSNAAFQNAIQPYVKDARLFVTPDASLPYRLNPAISGLPLGSLANPSTTEILRDPQLNPDGTLNIGYADGHVAQQADLLPRTIVTGTNDDTDLLWNDAHNGDALWTLTPANETLTQTQGRLDAATALGVGIGIDGNARLLWNRGGGAITLQVLRMDGTPVDTRRYGPYDGWTPLFLATGLGNESRVLWRYDDGTFALWRVSSNGRYLSDVRLSTPAGDSVPIGMTHGGNGRTQLLWKMADGSALLWTFSAKGRLEQATSFQPHAGFSLVGLGRGPDSGPRLLWDNGSGQDEVWTLTPSAQVQSQVAFPLGTGWKARAVTAGRRGDLRVLSASPGGAGRLQTVLPDGTVADVHDLPPYPDPSPSP